MNCPICNKNLSNLDIGNTSDNILLFTCNCDHNHLITFRCEIHNNIIHSMDIYYDFKSFFMYYMYINNAWVISSTGHKKQYVRFIAKDKGCLTANQAFNLLLRYSKLLAFS